VATIKILSETIELIKISDEEYFSPKYKDYISNSRLGFLNEAEGGSVEKYKEGFGSSDYSDSFELGSAVHALILQPESYFISKHSKPTGKLGEFANELFKIRSNSKDVKLVDAIEQASIKANYYSGKLKSTRLKTAIKGSIGYYLDRLKLSEVVEGKAPLYLSEPLKVKLNNCILGVNENEDFNNKLYPLGVDSFNEYAIFCEAEVDIDGVIHRIKLKGKLDNFTIDTEKEVIVLNDLKTSGKPVKFFMGNWVKEISEDREETKRWYNGSFQTYHYYRQMAMYLFLLKHAVLQYYGLDFKMEANMLVVETTPNYKSAVYKVHSKYIEAGLKEFKELIIKLIECNLHKQV